MLRKLLPCLFSLFGLLPAASAQQSLLWKISGNGIQKPSYIFGTMHMMCPSDYFMPAAVKQAFSTADTVYMELDMDDPMMMIEVGQLAKLPEGKTLKQLFTAEEYKELTQFFTDSLKMDIKLFDQFKPFVVMSMMAQHNFKCSNLKSYEEDFVKMATSQHKTIKGLETPQQQVAAFEAMGDKGQVKMIMKNIRDSKEGSDEFSQMLKLYKQQHLDGLYKLMERYKDLEGYDQELLDKRNNNWMPVIKRVTGPKSVFFAVGALHLAGPKGVLALLKQAGYTVTAVK